MRHVPLQQSESEKHDAPTGLQQRPPEQSVPGQHSASDEQLLPMEKQQRRLPRSQNAFPQQMKLTLGSHELPAVTQQIPEAAAAAAVLGNEVRHCCVQHSESVLQPSPAAAQATGVGIGVGASPGPSVMLTVWFAVSGGFPLSVQTKVTVKLPRSFRELRQTKRPVDGFPCEV